MPEYTVVDLPEEQLEAACLLLGSVASEIDRDALLDRVRAFRSSGGILGLIGPGGTLLGILCYQKQQMLRHGATLGIDTLVAFDLMRPGLGKQMLLEAAMAAAERLHCAAIAYPADDRLVIPLGRRGPLALEKGRRDANLSKSPQWRGAFAPPKQQERVQTRCFVSGRRFEERPSMEYGEAITTQAFERAVKIARQRRDSRGEPLPRAASEAVAQAYCVCVTDGEDAAEHRFSDVHRKLIDDVIARVTLLDRDRPSDNSGD